MKSITGILLLYKDGRKKSFFTGYRPLFNIKGNKYTGLIILDNKEQLFPGEQSNVRIDFLTDNLDINIGDMIAFDEGRNKKLGEVKILTI